MRAFVLVIALVFTSALQGFATGPDEAWGRYTYSSQDLNITFDIASDGLRNVRVNGKPYRDAKGLEDFKPSGGNFGSQGSFPYSVVFQEAKGHIPEMRLDLLLYFGNNGRLLRVAGIYCEERKNDQGVATTLQSRVIQMKFRHADVTD